MTSSHRPPGYLTEDLQPHISGPARYTSLTDKQVEHVTLADIGGTVIGYLYANDDDDAAGWVPRATATPAQQNLASPWVMWLSEAKARGIKPSVALDELLDAAPSNQSRVVVGSRSTDASLEALRQRAATCEAQPVLHDIQIQLLAGSPKFIYEVLVMWSALACIGMAFGGQDVPVAALSGSITDETGRPMRQARVESWRWDTGDPAGEPARHFEPVHTDEHGRFRLILEEPRPEHLGFRASASDRASLVCRSMRIPSEGTRDLGRLTMPLGVRIRGTVRDTRGRPAPGIALRLMGQPHMESYPGTVHSRTLFFCRTNAAGEFELDEPCAIRAYGVTASRRLISHTSLWPALAAEAVSWIVEAEEEATHLAGRVLDEDGRPIEGAEIDEAGEPRADRPATFAVRTDAQGRFRFPLRHPPGLRPIQLVCRAGGFEEQTSPPLEEGRGELECVMRRTSIVELHLSAPFADPTSLGKHMLQWRRATSPRGAWSHPPVLCDDDGRCRLTNLGRGTFEVKITPQPSQASTSRASTSQIVMIDVDAAPVRVELGPCSERTIRLQHLDGTPIAGSCIQVLTHRSGEIHTHRWGNNPTRHSWNPIVEVLAEVVSDEHGEVSISGRDGFLHTVIARGPHHVSAERNFRCDSSEPCVWTVETGSKLHLRIQPRELISELRRIGGVSGDLHAEEVERQSSPYISAQRRSGSDWPSVLQEEVAAPVRSDGSCELMHLAPGDWDLYLRWRRLEDHAGSWPDGGWLASISIDSEIAAHELNFELSDLLPRCFEGRVFSGGVPYCGRFWLCRERTTNRWRSLESLELGSQLPDHAETLCLFADADGRFSADLPNGAWYAQSLRELPEHTSFSAVETRSESVVLGSVRPAQEHELVLRRIEKR